MPAATSPMSSQIPALSALSREAPLAASARPMLGPAGATRMGLDERDLMADLEPHWVAAIDAATD
jgi:hypothetical protein